MKLTIHENGNRLVLRRRDGSETISELDSLGRDGAESGRRVRRSASGLDDVLVVDSSLDGFLKRVRDPAHELMGVVKRSIEGISDESDGLRGGLSSDRETINELAKNLVLSKTGGESVVKETEMVSIRRERDE